MNYEGNTHFLRVSCLLHITKKLTNKGGERSGVVHHILDTSLTYPIMHMDNIVALIKNTTRAFYSDEYPFLNRI